MSPWWVWGYFIITVILTGAIIFWLEYTRIKGLGLDGRPEVEKRIEKPETLRPEKKEPVEAGEKK